MLRVAVVSPARALAAVGALLLFFACSGADGRREFRDVPEAEWHGGRAVLAIHTLEYDPLGDTTSKRKSRAMLLKELVFDRAAPDAPSAPSAN